MNRKYALLLACLLCFVACSPGYDPGAGRPNAASEDKAAAAAPRSWPYPAMVSVANPQAADAAVAVLQRGGHAVDAAIAAHAVLGLVEPESSGPGGSAFMLVYDRSTDSTVVFDGREKAPSGATADMFEAEPEPLDFRELWALGITVGVPGAVSVYEAAHARFGHSHWADLFAPAIRLATEGFTVTEKMVRYNDALQPLIATGAFPDVAEYLFPGGVPLSAGDTKTNPDYASTLRRLADEGAAAFYHGDIAAKIVARAGLSPAGSSMTAGDLSSYSTVLREPVCGGFRNSRICSVPPPSSGIAQITIPALYDELLTGKEASLNDKIQVFVDAQRLAYADRDHFVGDPAFTDVPVKQLLDPQYLHHRATERYAPDEMPMPGDPWSVSDVDKAAQAYGADATVEAAGTTHLSIIDGEGNAVSMTASVGFPYGSVRMTSGFFLNNELTDFSRDPPADGPPSANAVAPGKRPRSSMSPTIIFDKRGEPLMLTGSAGGSSILAYSAKTILGVLDWGLSAQQAVDFPNIVARGETVGVEVSAEGGEAIAEDLTARGYDVTAGRGENSGLHVIVVRPQGLDGAADSRRHGVVRTVQPQQGGLPAPVEE